jgi:hypothetical protein
MCIVESYIYNFEDILLVHEVRPQEYVVCHMFAVSFMGKVVSVAYCGLVSWYLIHIRDRDVLAVTYVQAMGPTNVPRGGNSWSVKSSYFPSSVEVQNE